MRPRLLLFVCVLCPSPSVFPSAFGDGVSSVEVCVCVCAALKSKGRPSLSVFDADLYETCFLTHVCAFSLFLTPMFVLLQDSVPMASPAFLLSLFVSIQVLAQVSPEPARAPYTLVSKQTCTRIHSLTHLTHLSAPVIVFSVHFY